MFCPRCGGEYREGFTWCADCDVALVEVLPEELGQEVEEEESAEGVEPAAMDREPRSLRLRELGLVLFVVFADQLAALFVRLYGAPPGQGLGHNAPTGALGNIVSDLAAI